MPVTSKISQYSSALAFTLSFLTPVTVLADTIVTLNTTLGNLQIELFDSIAPQTVNNFLNYVNSGAYNNSFIHRSVPGFIIQGGGYTWDTVNNTGYSTIKTNSPVVNEYSLPNIAGTIAMAKVSGDPNSATDQWFFNLADNRANLDNQNGGFTVFGQVLGNGMSILNTIASLNTINAGGAFTNLPLAQPLSGGFTTNNLVMIYSAQVTGNTSPVPISGLTWLYGSLLIAGLKLTRARLVSGNITS